MANRSFIARHPILTLSLVFLCLLVGLAGYGFYLYQSNEGAWLKPDLQKMTMEIKEITPDSLKAQVKLGIHNTLPISVRIDSLSYQVALDGDTLIQGSQHQPTELKASSDDQLSIPMHTDFHRLIKKIKQLQTDSAQVHIRMTLYQDFPVVGTKPLAIEKTHTVYIPKLPKVEIEKVKINKLGLKGGQVVATLKITNYNDLAFTIKHFDYHFRLSDNVDVKGKEQKDIHFNKPGSQTVDIPIDLKLSQAGEAAFKMLFKSKSTPYQMDGKMLISTGKKFIGDFTMEFNSQGNIQELKDSIKKK